MDEPCSGSDVRPFRHEEALGGLALDGFTAPIVALGGGHIGMASESLYCSDIGASIQQAADGGPAQVMRVKPFTSCR